MSQLLGHRSGYRRGRFENPGRTPSGRAAEDVIGEGGYLQQDKDRGNERNQQYGKPADELEGRDVAGALQCEHADDKIADDVDDRSGDNFVEGVLQETAQPAPEEPFEFRHDEERHEDGANKNTDGGGDKSIGDNNDRNGLCTGQKNDDDDVDGHAQKIRNTGGIDACFKIANAVDDGLQLGLIDFVCKKLRFVGDQVVEADADARDGIAVVIDHGETEGDGEK